MSTADDLSPAERYADYQRGRKHPVFRTFEDLYSFPLDPFQVRACHEIEEGRGVLVAAPTGSGKTIVGEFAVHLALETGRKCFYTTPIKALSNQKYHDLVARYGPDQVGLLTGDNSVNGEAPIVVMTTEVLRNMLYAGSRTLLGLGLRRDGRGPLPGRPGARRSLGGGDHPPAGVGGAGLALGHRLERRGVRRVAGHRARRHDHDRRGEAAGPALPARHGRQAAARPVRPVRRRRRCGVREGGRPGQQRAAEDRPRRLGQQPDEGPPLAARPLRPRRAAGDARSATAAGSGSRAGST